MARRGPETQWRFLLNTDVNHLEVHDLDNENNNCQIDEIIHAKNAKYLPIRNITVDLEMWLRNNPRYDGCKYCLERYHLK